jgi:hypothetical protein
MERCAKCEELQVECLLTAYGDWLCEDCWDDYICTDEGKVEYFIGICKGDYPPSEFDAEFLGETVLSWKKNRDRLDFRPEVIEHIEATAVLYGLLD